MKELRHIEGTVKFGAAVSVSDEVGLLLSEDVVPRIKIQILERIKHEIAKKLDSLGVDDISYRELHTPLPTEDFKS